MIRVVISNAIADTVAERLRASHGKLDVPIEFVRVDRDGQGAALEATDAVLRGDLSDHGLTRVLAGAPRLRWVHSASAGVESLPLDELRLRAITLTNGAGVFAVPISEWVLTAMLMSVKHAHAMYDAQREHRWTRYCHINRGASRPSHMRLCWVMCSSANQCPP